MEDEGQRIDFYWSDIIPAWFAPAAVITIFFVLVLLVMMVKWIKKNSN